MENNCFHLNLLLLQVAVKLGHCIISGSTQRQNADESNRSWILIQKRGLFFYVKTLLITEIWQFYFFILLSLENLNLKNDREADKSGRGKPVKVISCTGLASMPFFSVRVSFLLGLKQEWWLLPFIPDLPPEIALSLPPEKTIHPTHFKLPVLIWVKLLSGREGFIGPDMGVFGGDVCLSV